MTTRIRIRSPLVVVLSIATAAVAADDRLQVDDSLDVVGRARPAWAALDGAPVERADRVGSSSVWRDDIGSDTTGTAQLPSFGGDRTELQRDGGPSDRLPHETFDQSSDTLNSTTVKPAPADGSWREEGQWIILNLNGQEFRLIKSESPEEPRPSANPAAAAGGGVVGRLSHRNQPLAACEVALIPLRHTWTGYHIARSPEPVTTKTDADGTYRFAGVPPGQYKLKWRPSGAESWIRRAEIEPDVRVRANETSHVQEIRVALRTIN